MKRRRSVKPFKIGQNVRWIWMGRPVKGSVVMVYFRPITKTFRGTVFKRNGTLDVPAYMVRSDAGSEVLKSHSELKRG